MEELKKGLTEQQKYVAASKDEFFRTMVNHMKDGTFREVTATITDEDGKRRIIAYRYE